MNAIVTEIVTLTLSETWTAISSETAATRTVRIRIRTPCHTETRSYWVERAAGSRQTFDPPPARVTSTLTLSLAVTQSEIWIVTWQLSLPAVHEVRRRFVCSAVL